MSVSSIGVPAFGSAAIASPPTRDANAQRDDTPAEASPVQQIVEASKPAGTGQLVDTTA